MLLKYFTLFEVSTTVSFGVCTRGQLRKWFTMAVAKYTIIFAVCSTHGTDVSRQKETVDVLPFSLAATAQEWSRYGQRFFSDAFRSIGYYYNVASLQQTSIMKKILVCSKRNMQSLRLITTDHYKNIEWACYSQRKSQVIDGFTLNGDIKKMPFWKSTLVSVSPFLKIWFQDIFTKNFTTKKCCRKCLHMLTWQKL